MFNFSNFFRKKDILGKKNVDIFENSIHFLILCIVLKNVISLPSGGPSPPDPLRGRMIAFKWPGRPPPKKNPGASPRLSWQIHSCEREARPCHWGAEVPKHFATVSL